MGYGFIAHGYAKLIRGPDQFAAILSALGMPAPEFLAWLTVAVEILGGLAVLAGALLPLAAIPLAATLLVAMFTVHFSFGFSSIKLQAVVSGHPAFGPPGYEVDLLYLVCLITLVVDGPGPLAFDNLLAKLGRLILPMVNVQIRPANASNLDQLADFYEALGLSLPLRNTRESSDSYWGAGLNQC